LAGWEQALTALVNDRGAALKRYAYLLCGDRTEADDLVQEALIRACNRPRVGRDAHELELYVRRMMVNRYIDQYRRLSRWLRLVPVLAERTSREDPTAVVTARADMWALLLQCLSPRQRACVVLRFYEDLTVSEISRVLGCSEGAVKRHLSEAMGRLSIGLGADRENV